MLPAVRCSGARLRDHALCCVCPRSPIGRRKQRLAKAGNAKPQAALATVRSHSSRSLLSEADPSTTWPAHKPRSRRDLELGIKRQGSSRRNLLRQSGDSARSLLSSRRPNRAVPLPASGEWCPYVDSWLCGRVCVCVCVFAWCRCNHLGADVIRAAQTNTDRHASPTAPRTSWSGCATRTATSPRSSNSRARRRSGCSRRRSRRRSSSRTG